MSTWRELYDDVLQELALYQEEVKLNPYQGMRMLTKGLSEFQRLTQIAEATKTITTAGNVTLTTAPYNLGSDILEIVEVLDPNGQTLMSTSYNQWNSIIERAKSGEIGYNETPAHMSYVRERPSSVDPAWDLPGGLGMVRIYTVWAQQLFRYPAETSDVSFTVRYRPNFEQFSSASTQWTNWFTNDAAFDANFSGLVLPPAQLVQWFPALVAYAVGQYLRSQNVLSGQQPLWMQYDNEFRQYVQQAIDLKPEYARNLVAPYNISPYSS